MGAGSKASSRSGWRGKRHHTELETGRGGRRGWDIVSAVQTQLLIGVAAAFLITAPLSGAAPSVAEPAAPLEAQAPPAQSAEDKALALALSRALASWIQRDVTAKGGKFLLFDAVAQEVLDLTAFKLDDGDHLHRLADGRFLSWGEFRDAAGRKYFLDFYFTRSGEAFTFDSEITIFSRDGVKRYGWDETGPAMKKIPVPSP